MQAAVLHPATCLPCPALAADGSPAAAASCPPGCAAQPQGLLDEGYLAPSDVRLCVGDAGWAAGQLEGEAARGTWALAE